MRHAVFILAFVSLRAFALPPLGIQDADNIDEAYGMMYSTVIYSEAMLRECAKRQPQLNEQAAADYRKWTIDDKPFIQLASETMTRLDRSKPGYREKYVAYTESVVNDRLNSFAKAPIPEIAKSGEAKYCLDFFKALAAGIQRTNTPNVYKLLSQKLK